MDTHLILQQAGRRPGSRCCELCSVAQMLSNLHGASRADDRQMDTATGCLTIRVGYSLQCRVPIHSTVNKQGAPVKNNPLRKIYISRNVVDFFTRFALLMEDVSNHKSSEFHCRILFDTKI